MNDVIMEEMEEMEERFADNLNVQTKNKFKCRKWGREHEKNLLKLHVQRKFWEPHNKTFFC